MTQDRIFISLNIHHLKEKTIVFNEIINVFQSMFEDILYIEHF